MSVFEYSRSPWTARMLSVLRIVTGLMFLTAGTTKLFGFRQARRQCQRFI